MIHKVIWEVLRQRADDKPVESKALTLTLIKGIKISILLGVIVQIWLPADVFPIAVNSLPVRSVGVVVYTLGLITAIAARIQLGKNWANIETGQVLERQSVVAKGVYGYVRHPIYVGDLLLLFGLELALNSWLVLGVLILAPIVMLKAVKEEQMLINALPGYAAYCSRSKRFIPFVY
ncbi:MAG: isoprenylcysteine carboxylmethyltransferase family protein [Pyrinomonadaceae bacterium]